MIENDDGSRALRNALGRFATGVTIVTAIDPDGHPIGLTANSFSAVAMRRSYDDAGASALHESDFEMIRHTARLFSPSGVSS